MTSRSNGGALSRREAWALTLVATLTMAVSYVDRQTFSVLAPVVTRALAITETQYGLLAGAFSLAYLVGAPVAGRWIDRVGARRGLLAALLVWTAVAALHALAPGFAALFALRIALGLAESPAFPGAAQTVHRALPPAERARGFGVLFVGGSLGAMIAPPVAAALLRTSGWRTAFLGTALVGLLWVPLWLALSSAPRARARLEPHRAPADADAPAPVPDPAASYRTAAARTPEEPPRPGPLALLGHAGVLRAVVLVLALSPTGALLLLFGAKLLVRQYGVAPVDMGRYLWMPPLFFDLGAVIFGDLAARRAPGRGGRPDTTLVAVASAMLVSVAAVAMAPTAWTAVTYASFAMAGAGALSALCTADMLARVPPSAISAAGGMTAAAQSLAYIVVSPVIGRVVELTGSYRGLVVALALWAVPGCLFWIAWPAPPVHGGNARAAPSD